MPGSGWQVQDGALGTALPSPAGRVAPGKAFTLPEPLGLSQLGSLM